MVIWGLVPVWIIVLLPSGPIMMIWGLVPVWIIVLLPSGPIMMLWGLILGFERSVNRIETNHIFNIP